MSSSEPVATVNSLFVYPVKSCRGIQLSHAPLSPHGIRFDREWLVVNAKGRGYTQRVEPKLALVQTELPSEAFDEGWEPTEDSFLVLNAPGMEPLKICLSKKHEVAEGVTIWDWSGSAWHEGAEAAKWFTDYLGKESTLIRFNSESQVRLADPDYYDGIKKVKFSDGYQYLIVSKGSWEVVNQHATEPIPINRFRPNIFVEGCEAFAEDLWSKIKINNSLFESVRVCFRCKIPQVNQETAEIGQEPAQTLMKIRSEKVLRPNGVNVHRSYFGQFLAWNPENSSESVIKVGDSLYVLEKVNHFTEAHF